MIMLIMITDDEEDVDDDDDEDKHTQKCCFGLRERISFTKR